MLTIGFSHRPPKGGGPGSFQTRLSAKLLDRGHRIVFPEDGIRPDVILLVGSTRKLRWLWENQRKGVPVVMRLAGLNWLHRVRSTPLSVSLRNWRRNLSLKFTRNFIADAIVYQTEFAREWWHRETRPKAREAIINNSVDLQEFAPNGDAAPRAVHLLCVEGHIDYSPYAVDLINYLADALRGHPGFDRVVVYGGFEDQAEAGRLSEAVDYRGRVAREDLPAVYRRGVYLSLDINAICPNTVIEALASGIPVVGFDTGALGELVTPEAGAVVPFGGDPWKLDDPDFPALAEAIKKVVDDWTRLSKGARQLAEKRFGLDLMVEKYERVLVEACRAKGKI